MDTAADQAPTLPAPIALIDHRLAPAVLELSRTSAKRLLAGGAEGIVGELTALLDPGAVHVTAVEWTGVRDLLCLHGNGADKVMAGWTDGERTLVQMVKSGRIGKEDAQDGFLKVFLDMLLRFTSGNEIQVERAMLPRSAWDTLRPVACTGYEAARAAWRERQKDARGARGRQPAGKGRQ